MIESIVIECWSVIRDWRNMAAMWEQTAAEDGQDVIYRRVCRVRSEQLIECANTLETRLLKPGAQKESPDGN